MNGEKTAFPGVRVFHNSDSTDSYYIQYRRGGRGSKLINELAGKSGPNGRGGMTAKKAAELRILKMRGIEASNEERRAEERAEEKDSMTLVKLWEIYKENNTDKPSLKQADRFSFARAHTLHEREIRSLSTQDIDKLTAQLKKTPAKRQRGGEPVKLLSPKSVKDTIEIVRRLCNYAESRELCTVPKIRFDFEKFDNRTTEYMTAGEYKKYIDALDAEADQTAATVIRVALFTGARKTAILKLRWRDINFDTNKIFLRAENAKKNEGAYIPLPSILVPYIKALPCMDGNDYLFPGQIPGSHRKTISRVSRRVKKAAGLPDDFRPMHGLRHNYATQLASSGGINAQTLQALLTHESPQMTDRYTTILDEALQRAGSIADKIFSPTTPEKAASHDD